MLKSDAILKNKENLCRNNSSDGIITYQLIILIYLYDRKGQEQAPIELLR
jgi:hypothetical protein